MTPKEKLLLKRLELSNEYSVLKGKDKIFDLDTFVLTREFTNEARKTTRDELLRDIESMQHCIDAERKRIAIEDWFKTPAGEVYKLNLESEIQNLLEKRQALFKSTTDKLQEMVTRDLGEGWGVRFTPHSTNIGRLAIGEEKEKGFYFQFGNTFEIIHSNLIYCDKEQIKYDKLQFDMTFPTVGRFSIAENTERVKYVIGMGKFLTLDLEPYKKTIYDAVVESYEIDEKYYQYKARLKDPSEFTPVVKDKENPAE